MAWTKLRELLYKAYFLNSIKQKLEEDLKNLQQSDISVQKDAWEFNWLLNYIPFVERDETHEVYLFERNLRYEIFTLI